MNKIMIHTAALGWHEVTNEDAVKFIGLMLKNSSMPKAQLVDYINENKLKGTTVQELLGVK